MFIEFYTPDKEVKEWIITYVRDAVLKLHSQHTEISRAEVYFKERKNQTASEKICEIDLSVFKGSVRITGIGKNFDGAARKAVAALTEAISSSFQTGTEPPNEIVSTVEV